MPPLKVKISISRAYFSTEETMADFFNRIGQKQTFGRIYGSGSTHYQGMQKPEGLVLALNRSTEI